MNPKSDRLLDPVLAHPGVWRGSDCAPEPAAIPTGFAALDAVLPGGGWPRAALTEMLLADEGIGELRLTLPGLVRLQAEGRDVVWVSPPYLPYAPALAAAGLDLSRLIVVDTRNSRDALWAFEQALKAPECGAAFLWPVEPPDDRATRRLQLAAREGSNWGVLWRRPGQAGVATTAALRLALAPAAGQLGVHVVKRRGGMLDQPILVDPDPLSRTPPVEAAASSVARPAGHYLRGTQ